ncbi:MAG: TM2 domain-containing protein [Tidjanibacter sp.]|nr:TM2 domain-containing protein [Tidjanibacter sp.]
MKKLMLTLAVALFAICSASANIYEVNDAAIDALVDNSVEMVMEAAPAGDMISLSSSKNPIIATALSVIPVTNWLAVHRYYLGTKVWMGLVYALTGSGFGILYVVDSVVLVLDLIESNNISGKYMNNGRILMWADLF